MTEATIPPIPARAQERHEQRQTNFYAQTVEQNNARLNGKNIPTDILDEIKFIESQLLASKGDPL